MAKICIDCGINKPIKNRKICNTCKHKRWRLKHPFEYAFNNLKNNAKSRNKEFNLTLDEFKKFAIESSYVKNKGYHKNNIQVLPNYLNIKKYIEYKYANENGKKIFKTMKNITNINKDDCPF